MLRPCVTVLGILFVLAVMTEARAEPVSTEYLSVMCRAPEKTSIKTFCYGFLNAIFGYAGGHGGGSLERAR